MEVLELPKGFTSFEPVVYLYKRYIMTTSLKEEILKLRNEGKNYEEIKELLN